MLKTFSNQYVFQENKIYTLKFKFEILRDAKLFYYHQAKKWFIYSPVNCETYCTSKSLTVQAVQN